MANYSVEKTIQNIHSKKKTKYLVEIKKEYLIQEKKKKYSFKKRRKKTRQKKIFYLRVFHFGAGNFAI